MVPWEPPEDPGPSWAASAMRYDRANYPLRFLLRLARSESARASAPRCPGLKQSTALASDRRSEPNLSEAVDVEAYRRLVVLGAGWRLWRHLPAIHTTMAALSYGGDPTEVYRDRSECCLAQMILGGGRQAFGRGGRRRCVKCRKYASF